MTEGSIVILCDPRNPMVLTSDLVREILALLPHAKCFTYAELSHRTLPGGTFSWQKCFGNEQPETMLWIEGGPIPSDIDYMHCNKIAYIFNSHDEPSLVAELLTKFHRIFSCWRMDQSRGCLWMPRPARRGLRMSKGVRFAGSSPITPSALQVVLALSSCKAADVNAVVTVGANGSPSQAVFDHMSLGVAVMVDSNTDVRDIGYPGDHLIRYESVRALCEIVGDVKAFDWTAIAQRGSDISKHLHDPLSIASRMASVLIDAARFCRRCTGRNISVITTCYRYAKRMRWFIESIVRQASHAFTLEIIVADPGSPDRVKEQLDEFEQSYPDVRFVHVPISDRFRYNRGYCINRAFEYSSGAVVIAADADVIFKPDLIATLYTAVMEAPTRVYGVRRRFLTETLTGQILNGEVTPWGRFKELSDGCEFGDGEPNALEGVLGYCQAVHRDAFARAGYPEEFNMINQSDIVFLERLAHYGAVHPKFLETEYVLHLWHPRNWRGTTDLL